MLGFSAISASPISAIRIVVVDAVNVSETVGFSTTLSAIGVNNLRVAESFDSSAAFNGGLTLNVAVQEATSVEYSDATQGEYSVNITDANALYSFIRINAENNVSLSESASVQDTPIGNTESNVTVQETVEVQADPNGRLLWEPVDDSQTPNWQVINTG